MSSLALALMLLQQAFPEDEFRRLHKELQPPADEVWRTIPWKGSLLEASQEAARERKPILVWAMHGHPLGSC